MSVRQQSKNDLIRALGGRYMKANKEEKGRILDEFTAATGYHRKRAIYLLRHGPPPERKGHGGRNPTHSAVVVGALRLAAETVGWPCGKRLAPFLKELVPALEAEGALSLSPADRERLMGICAATIDRRLRPYRSKLKGFGIGTTKPGSLLKSQVPIHTFTPWEDQKPGFVEIDLVAHCGTSVAGQFAYTLTVTDVATGWTECAAVRGKGQTGVLTALEMIRRRIPFPLLGIDSDNGSEFLNDQLIRYCRENRITFTRSRPYWKNDQAHVEQKNWSVVRKLVGYDRLDNKEAMAPLNSLYVVLSLWTNHWQPVLKLTHKERDGAKVRKRYDVAQTPYRRLLAANLLTPSECRSLEKAHNRIGPVAIRQKLEQALKELGRVMRHYEATIPLR